MRKKQHAPEPVWQSLLWWGCTIIIRWWTIFIMRGVISPMWTLVMVMTGGWFIIVLPAWNRFHLASLAKFDFLRPCFVCARPWWGWLATAHQNWPGGSFGPHEGAVGCGKMDGVDTEIPWKTENVWYPPEIRCSSLQTMAQLLWWSTCLKKWSKISVRQRVNSTVWVSCQNSLFVAGLLSLFVPNVL